MKSIVKVQDVEPVKDAGHRILITVKRECRDEVWDGVTFPMYDVIYSAVEEEMKEDIQNA